MMPDKLIDALRDRFSEYHNSFRWEVKGGKWPGVAFDFSHTCGDTCCSWNENYFIDDGDELLEANRSFFTSFPRGEEFVYDGTESQVDGD